MPILVAEPSQPKRGEKGHVAGGPSLWDAFGVEETPRFCFVFVKQAPGLLVCPFVFTCSLLFFGLKQAPGLFVPLLLGTPVKGSTISSGTKFD